MKTSNIFDLVPRSETPADSGSMSFRTEKKYCLNPVQHLSLKKKCSSLMERDRFCGDDGSYTVRSLYFETPCYDSFFDKELGAVNRAKIRLRTYIVNSRRTGVFNLEEKRKNGSLSGKISCALSAEQADSIASGDYSPLLEKGADGIYLYAKLKANLYRPLTIVEYKRFPFSFKLDNLRITFDCDVRHSAFSFEDWARPALYPLSANGDVVMEVKYNKFLPGWLKSSLRGAGIVPEAISKYGGAVYDFI